MRLPNPEQNNKMKLTKTILILMFMIILSSFVCGEVLLNLESYYPFDTDADDVHGSQDLTVVGATLSSTSKLGTNSYSFDGTSSKLTYFSGLINDSYSLSLWFKLYDTSSYKTIYNDDKLILKVFPSSDGTHPYSLYVATQETPGGNTKGYFTTTEFSTTDWYHIVLNYYSYDNVDLYINGTNETFEATDTPSSYSVSTTTIGYSERIDTHYFKGYIDEIGIWNTTLTDDQITELYNSYDGLSYSKFGGDVLLTTIISPSNNSNVGVPININYTLTGVNITANCSLYNNEIFVVENTGLINNTYSFNLNETYWEQGYNNISITCTDYTSTSNDNVTLFVDAVTPVINYINYSIGSNTYTLNKNIFSVGTKFNLTIQSEDINNYLMNVTITRSGYGTVKFSNQTINVDSLYNWSHEINTTGYVEGWYKVNVTTADAHTKNKIKFDKELVPTDYIDNSYIGKVFDGKAKTYVSDNDISSFDLIQDFDRYKFQITFSKVTDKFDIYVEGESNTEYLGDKYGYQGHFIIDNKYWYDLETDIDGVYIKKVQKNGNGYKISMVKPLYVMNLEFKSIGLINTNSEARYFYVKQYLGTTTYENLRFISSENVTLNVLVGSYASTTFELPRNVNLTYAFLSFNTTQSIINPYAKIGDNTYNLWSYTGTFNDYMTSGNFVNNLTNVPQSCSCTGCSVLANGNCSIPVKVYSSTSGNITLNNLYFGYNTISIPIEIYNQDTLNLISGVNCSVDVIGTISSYNYSTTLGNFSIHIPYDDYIFKYVCDGFNERFRNLEIDNSVTKLELFLVNNSDATDCLFVVYDQNGLTVEGAVIEYLAYNIATNSYNVVGSGTTDFEGETNLYVTLNNQYYKFRTYYPLGTLREETQRSYILSCPKYINIDTSDASDTIFNNIAGMYSSLRFDNNTNVFTWSYSDSNSLGDNYCMDVFKISVTEKTLINNSCYTDTSKIFSLGVSPINGTTYLAQAYLTQNSKEYLIDAISYTFEELNPFNSNIIGIFVIFILTMVFIFLTTKYLMTILLVPLPLFLGVYAGIVPFGIGAAVVFEIIAIIIAFIINQNR